MCKPHWRQVPRDLQREVYASAKAMQANLGDVDAYQRWRADAESACEAVEGDSTPGEIPQPITAKFDGTCGLCDLPIWAGTDQEQGEEVVYLNGEGWVHYNCALEHEEQAA